ncbi:MAG TPA: hypothetical protein VJ812_12225 [Gemmatimonadaceae bacterium]|jgi:hypothetical protein|nr:hypothetical protein [Gemmatimonadaceae bacterium]
MRRSITLENMEAITDPHTAERTRAHWRRTRARLLRVLFYALLIIGGVQLCALSRSWTTVPAPDGEVNESGSRASTGLPLV